MERHTLKRCTVCDTDKDTSEFYKCAAKKDGISYRCKTCDNKARLQYIKDNPAKHKESLRGRMLKKRYGITLIEYNNMCEEQGNHCALCGCEKENNNRGMHHLSVDHCHKTGKIRGILCSNCNRGLGLLGDDLESIQRVIKYLERQDDTH